MQNRFSPLQLLIFILGLGILVAIVQVGLLSIAFDKLGLSSESAFTLLISSLFGSLLNLPLFTVDSTASEPAKMPEYLRLLRLNHLPFNGKTIIAVNVGGCLIPVTFCAYLLSITQLGLYEVLAGVACVTLVSYLISRPVPGLGIGMPIFIAPLTAAIIALMINPEHSAPLAYIAGTLGVIIGADLLRLKNIRAFGVPVASIGGAGTFDGIFITGIIAVLLA